MSAESVGSHPGVPDKEYKVPGSVDELEVCYGSDYDKKKSSDATAVTAPISKLTERPQLKVASRDLKFHIEKAASNGGMKGVIHKLTRTEANEQYFQKEVDDYIARDIAELAGWKVINSHDTSHVEKFRKEVEAHKDRVDSELRVISAPQLKTIKSGIAARIYDHPGQYAVRAFDDLVAKLNSSKEANNIESKSKAVEDFIFELSRIRQVKEIVAARISQDRA